MRFARAQKILAFVCLGYADNKQVLVQLIMTTMKYFSSIYFFHHQTCNNKAKKVSLVCV